MIIDRTGRLRPILAGSGILTGCVAVVVLLGSPSSSAAQVKADLERSRLAEVGGIESGEGHDLLDVSAGTLLADGSIVVASAGTHVVHLFNSKGEFVRRLGAHGQGPGEFWGRIAWVRGVGHDTIFAYDAGLRRVSAFMRDGALIGTYTIELPRTLFGGQVQPRFDEGAFLVVRRKKASERVQRAMASGVLEQREGSSQESIEFVLGQESRWDTVAVLQTRGLFTVRYDSDGPPASFTAEVPFESPVLWATGDRSFVVGFGDSVGVEIFNQDGRTTGSIRPEGPVRAVTAADRRAYRRRLLEEGKGGEPFRPVRSLFLEKTPWGEHVPFYSEAVVDRVDRIWLERYPEDEGARVFDVFNSAGQGVFSVELPGGVQVLEAGRDYVLVKRMGSFDEEIVDVLRLNADPLPPVERPSEGL